MRAMILNQLVNLKENDTPLKLASCPAPQPAADEILIKVSACGVCHTELDEIEGRTPPPHLPVIPGHQVVGTVHARGRLARRYQVGDRVGVAWIFSACGQCKACLAGYENLCPDFMATGRDANGGYAQYMTVPQAYACPVPDLVSDLAAAPLLCAGAIGYRSLELTGLRDGQKLGLTGFGASGHLVLMMAKYRYPHAQIYVFARSAAQKALARDLGADWTGGIRETPPGKLDCIIDTTPAWTPVLAALENLTPGGRLVINAIRKEKADQDALLSLHYADHLWLEKEVKSVANVTRQDVTECLALVAGARITPEVQEYPLEAANQALTDLKKGNSQGAKVLKIR